MKKLLRTTNGTLLMFIFGAYFLISLSAPYVVTSYKIDDSVINLEKVFRNDVQLSDITARATDDDTKSLITYQPINQPKAISAEEAKVVEGWRLFELKVNGFKDIGGKGDSLLLISTPDKDSCRENSTLPAWKIDKRVSQEGKFRLKINHAKQLAGNTFYLCYLNESSGQFQHFGNKSRFSIDIG